MVKYKNWNTKIKVYLLNCKYVINKFKFAKQKNYKIKNLSLESFFFPYILMRYIQYTCLKD